MDCQSWVADTADCVGWQKYPINLRMLAFLQWLSPLPPTIAYDQASRPGALEEMYRMQEETPLTVNSTKQQVRLWLKLHGYKEYIPVLGRYAGRQLLCMTVDEEEKLKASLEGTLKHSIFISIKRCRELADIAGKNIYGHTCVIHL
jgi:hypothetical protein